MFWSETEGRVAVGVEEASRKEMMAVMRWKKDSGMDGLSEGGGEWENKWGEGGEGKGGGRYRGC